jgi:hypothetical protein
MMHTRRSKVLTYAVLAGSFAALATLLFAADDTARFYGTWKTEFPYYGQNVTMVSVHDASGYKNYILVPNGAMPTGVAPVGDGTFSAANGKYAAAAAKPNNSGTYRFTDDNTIVCTNAAGQTVTWKRYREKLPRVIGTDPPAYPSHVYATMKSVLAESRKRGMLDAAPDYIRMQWYPPNVPDSVKTFWLKLAVYSPSTHIVCSVDSGGPNAGAPLCGSINGYQAAAMETLPANINVDLADFISGIRKGGLKGPIGSLELRMAGATGAPQFPAWVLEIQGGPAWVPLFVNAQDGSVVTWQRAMDPPNGSDAQLADIYGRLLNRNQPGHQKTNWEMEMDYCIYALLGNC